VAARHLALVSAIVCLGVAWLSGCGSSSGSVARRERYDPYVLIAGHLRNHLNQTGIHIRFSSVRGEAIPTLRGVASVGPELVGFEYQLFPSARVASTRNLRHVQAEDFGWQERPGRASERPRIRGILSNVAFAEYEKLPLPSHRPRRSHFPDLIDRQRVLRGLDNALFSAFPARDAYVHPRLKRPTAVGRAGRP
jgi:hypothetical protein